MERCGPSYAGMPYAVCLKEAESSRSMREPGCANGPCGHQAEGHTCSTIAVSSASLSWVSRFLPQEIYAGFRGQYVKQFTLVNFLGRIIFSGRRCPAAYRDAGCR